MLVVYLVGQHTHRCFLLAQRVHFRAAVPRICPKFGSREPHGSGQWHRYQRGHRVRVQEHFRELLVHLSPLGWEHINLTGDYVWHANRRVTKGHFRPLRQPREAPVRWFEAAQANS